MVRPEERGRSRFEYGGGGRAEAPAGMQAPLAPLYARREAGTRRGSPPGALLRALATSGPGESRLAGGRGGPGNTEQMRSPRAPALCRGSCSIPELVDSVAPLLFPFES